MQPGQQELLKLLQNELARARSRNPQYSLRAFSKRLGIPVSAVSSILNLKMPITLKNGEKIITALSVDPRGRAKILSDLKHRENGLKNTHAAPGKFTPIDMDQFHLICDWYYFGILSLACTEGFEGTSDFVSSRLGIQKRQAKVALARLERLGFLDRDEKGLHATGKQFKTSDGIQNAFLRKHHLEGLDLARRSMEEDELSTCDFSSITMSVNVEKLAEAKKMIAHFRKSLSAFLESGSQTEVYRMSVQLLPLSHREKFSKKNLETKLKKGSQNE